MPQFSQAIEVQPRALMVPRPAFFNFEPMPPRRGDEEKLDNEIEKGRHQVDPHRPVGFIPVMPNITMLRDTGNPYPSDGTHETVITNDRWRKYVGIAHVVWHQARKRDGILFTANDIVDDVANVSGEGRTKTGVLTSEFTYAVFDCLRDLALYGLLDREEGIKMLSYKKTKFGNVDVANVKTIDEYLAEGGVNPGFKPEEPVIVAAEVEKPAKPRRARAARKAKQDQAEQPLAAAA